MQYLGVCNAQTSRLRSALHRVQGSEVCIAKYMGQECSTYKGQDCITYGSTGVRRVRSEKTTVQPNEQNAEVRNI